MSRRVLTSLQQGIAQPLHPTFPQPFLHTFSAARSGSCRAFSQQDEGSSPVHSSHVGASSGHSFPGFGCSGGCCSQGKSSWDGLRSSGKCRKSSERALLSLERCGSVQSLDGVQSTLGQGKEFLPMARMGFNVPFNKTIP